MRYMTAISFPAFFRPDECEELCDLMRNPVEVSDKRGSYREQVFPVEKLGEYAARVAEAMRHINGEVWKLDLDTLAPEFAIREYKSGDFEAWAVPDGSPDSPFNGHKLTAIAQLTPPTAYAGGRIDFTPRCGCGIVDYGALIVFPSFRPVGMTPLQWGTRQALITHMNGPQWR